jgi:hypothetical protein
MCLDPVVEIAAVTVFSIRVGSESSEFISRASTPETVILFFKLIYNLPSLYSHLTIIIYDEVNGGRSPWQTREGSHGSTILNNK